MFPPATVRPRRESNVKKLIASGLICGLLMLGSIASALAAPDQSVPGTPGAQGCEGQTMAYLAQLVKSSQAVPEEHRPGLGNLADITGLSLQGLHALAAAYCGPRVLPDHSVPGTPGAQGCEGQTM